MSVGYNVSQIGYRGVMLCREEKVFIYKTKYIMQYQICEDAVHEVGKVM